MNILKMSMKALGCTPGDCVEKKAPIDMCIIFGRATSASTQGFDNNGVVSTVLNGTFEGKNLQTGETMTSTKLYLPVAVQDDIEASLKKAPNAAVEFGYRFIAVPANNKSGYTFNYEVLTASSAVDPLAKLRNSIMGASDEKSEATQTSTGSGVKQETGNSAKADTKKK